jgi:hypothetical protein
MYQHLVCPNGHLPHVLEPTGYKFCPICGTLKITKDVTPTALNVIEWLPQILKPAKRVIEGLGSRLALEASYHESTNYDDLTEQLIAANIALNAVLQAQKEYLVKIGVTPLTIV